MFCLFFFRSVPITTSSLQVSEATDKELENRKSLKKKSENGNRRQKEESPPPPKVGGAIPDPSISNIDHTRGPTQGGPRPPFPEKQEKKLIRRLPRSSGFDSMASAKRRPSWPPWGSTAPPLPSGARIRVRLGSNNQLFRHTTSLGVHGPPSVEEVAIESIFVRFFF